jgi:phage tail-like protein
MLGDDHTPVARFQFREGWPAKWEGPKFNARSSEVAIETLEIAHEGLEVEFE